ncbi:hypothetical protein M0R45_014041 [Rubus argutus]|uniref:Uncharacterized protein n=1 Tax=Rubus argutus TaxID=59490 RepID=A0AAW1XKB1_RUBAR
MKLGYQQSDFDASLEEILNGSFRKFTSGLLQNDLELSPGHSSNGSSFRRSSSIISTHSVSGNSASSKFTPSKRRVFKGLKDYARKLVDLELFTHSLEDWVLENSCEDSADGEQSFTAPFMMDELHKLDWHWKVFCFSNFSGCHVQIMFLVVQMKMSILHWKTSFMLL